MIVILETYFGTHLATDCIHFPSSANS